MYNILMPHDKELYGKTVIKEILLLSLLKFAYEAKRLICAYKFIIGINLIRIIFMKKKIRIIDHYGRLRYFR